MMYGQNYQQPHAAQPAPQSPYVTGPNMTSANAMMQAGSSTAPVGNWTQGMARIADALVAGNQKRQMMAQQQGAPAQPGAMGAVLGATAPQ